MADLKISVCEPFMSPAWGSNLVIFSSISEKAISEDETKDYLAKACKYASKFEIYLIPQRFIILGIEGLCVIDPKGKVLTAQQQIFTSRISNNSFNTAKTVFGEICLCVNDDIYHPEIGKIAYHKGAKIIVSSQPLSVTENNNHKIVSGVWGTAQNNNLYVIGISNQSNCVCAPKTMTKNHEGFLVSPTTKPFIVSLPIEKLNDLPSKPFLSRQFYFTHREDLIGEESWLEKRTTKGM